MKPESKLQRVRDDLVIAMDSGEVSSEGPELVQLACDLTASAFPEKAPQEGLDAFSLWVGSVIGAALQKYEES